MQQPFVKYISTFLFLAAFLVPRFADLHALEHLSGDDDTTSCELCDIAVHNQHLDLFLGDITCTKEIAHNLPSTHIVQSLYNSPLASIVTPTSVYNKPPPTIIFG